MNKIIIALAILGCLHPAVAVHAAGVTDFDPANDPGGIRGLIKPSTSAVLSSEINARVTGIPFRDGQKFKKGDILLKFDCATYQAEVNSARAEYDSKKLQYENNVRLLELEAMSEIDLKISKAEADKARAALTIANIQAGHCRIKAPYAGKVVQVMINEHESISAGGELISILSDENLEIELIVPSSWLNWLKTGEKFRFRVDETQMEHEVIVDRLGASVDPVSQTIQILGKFQGSTGGAIPGMSGTAVFNSP